jgi:hypothetical protein
MRHPSELFILSLLVDQRTDAEVRRLVEAFGLPPLTDEALPYIAELRARAYATRPVGFTGARTEDRRYLREMHVDGLHHPDMYATRALSVLQLPAARTDLFLGLIGRVNPRELASHLSNKHGLTVCTQTLRVLKHYYFNVDIIGIDEWAALLPEGGVDSARMVACLEGGPITAAYRIGLDRASNVKDAVYDIVAAVHATVQEVRNWETTPEKVRVLADSMSTLARAHTVLNTADMELAAVATELRQFKLSRSAEKPLPLALLSKDMRALPAPDMEKQSVKVK